MTNSYGPNLVEWRHRQRVSCLYINVSNSGIPEQNTEGVTSNPQCHLTRIKLSISVYLGACHRSQRAAVTVLMRSTVSGQVSFFIASMGSQFGASLFHAWQRSRAQQTFHVLQRSGLDLCMHLSASSAGS